jgi:hypothetical protein
VITTPIFEILKPAQSAKRADMLIAIHDFASKLKSARADAVGFLYYSGHGIASAGENYLVPVDIDEPSTVLLSVQGAGVAAGVNHLVVRCVRRLIPQDG